MCRSLLIFLLVAAPLFSQSYERILDAIPVFEDGQPLPLAFAGGTYVPKAQLIDIDADGDPDLFVTQVDGRLTFFRNAGSHLAPDFRWETDHYENLQVFQWSRFADLDGDGDVDLLTNRPGSRIAGYENTGNPFEAVFSLWFDELLDAAGSPVLSEDPSVPCLADIDGDGDLDLFSGRSLGTVALYANTGTASEAEFTFITDVFEGIVIITPGLRRMHGASSIVFQDIDNDDDLDLFWGDFFSSGLYYLENLGTPLDPLIPDTTTSTYPQRELLTSGFNAPLFSDLDGDSDPDLLISVLYRDADIDNFWYYRNDGSPSAAQFTLTSKNLIRQVDVGRQSRPVLTDIDDDGDMDMFLGSYNGRVHFFRNTGSETSAVFVRDTAVSVPVGTDEFIAAPAFADMDADGDFDAVVGFFTGRLSYLENIGTARTPFFSLVTSQFSGIDVGNNAAPSFGDFDGDGDDDLLIGRTDGLLRWYRNFGSGSSAQFHPDSLVSNFTGISAGSDAVPQCIDRDGDGDLDIVVGNKEGSIVLFENVGSATSPAFQLTNTEYAGIRTTLNAAPWFADVDGDGDLDLFLGNIKGGLEFHRAASEAAAFGSLEDETAVADSLWTLHISPAGLPRPRVAILEGPPGMTWDSVYRRLSWRPRPEDEGLHAVRLTASNETGADTAGFLIRVIARIELAQNFPNPFNGETTIEFALARASDVEVTIYNILGQRVRRLVHSEKVAGVHRIAWDGLNDAGRSVTSGIYLYRLKAGSISKTKKLVLVK